MKLNQIGDFNAGVNPSRVKNYEEVIYSQLMFDCDIENRLDLCSFSIGNEMENYRVKEGDVLIRTVSPKAAVVSKEHAGAIYTANYIKADLLVDTIYNRYFVYIFNNNREVIKQVANNVQGTATTRVTTSLLKDIEIPILPLEIQKKIGDLYFEALKLKNLYNTKAEQITVMTETYLEQIINKDKEH